MRAGILILVLSAAHALAPAALASFPGRNGKLAVTQECFNGDEFAPYVHAFGPDGTNLGPLTARCQVEGTNGSFGPDWSADGERLAFWMSDDDSTFNFGTANADGSGQRATPVKATFSSDSPSFSPGGQRIAFARHGAIWTAKLDGTQERRLRRRPRCGGCLSYVTPEWSPGGGRIAFETDGDGTKRFRPGLFVIKPNGKGFKRIARGYVSEVDWAPNGKRLVYQTDYSTDGSGGNLWTIKPNGKGRKRLLRTPGSAAATVPAWAPNGKAIAFVRLTFGSDAEEPEIKSALMRIRRRGGKPTRIRALGSPSVGEDGYLPPALAWQPLPR